MSGLVVEANENIHLKNNQEKYNIKLGIREWKRYPEYKDSGVEWIGEIPKEWNIKPLKQITEFISRGNGPDYVDQSSIRVINQACIYWDGLNLENIKYQRETNVSGWKGLLQKGDLLINSTGTGTLGRASIFDQTGTFIVDSHVTIVRSNRNDILANYLFYLIQTLIYQGFIYSALVSGSTNQIELSKEGLRITPIIIPSLYEQKNIVALLDHETSRIDTLIEKKQLFIKLLEEKRSALISHAVTKGLDPDVKMKDSGVEWIGEIPKSWNAIKIKRLCQVKRGASPRPIDNLIYFDDDGEYSWVRISDVTASNKYLRVTEQKLSLLGQSKSVCLEPGSLFLSIAGSVGKPIITKIKCCIHDGFVYFEGLKQNSEYLFYLFSCGEMYKGLGKLGTQLNLNTDTIGDIRIPVPFPKEQEEIVNFLDHETEKIDTFINKISAQIEKLKEYRTALISAAVTGKIDVREEVE